MFLTSQKVGDSIIGGGGSNTGFIVLLMLKTTYIGKQSSGN